MKIIREVVSWKNEVDDCDKLYNKLGKSGSLKPIKISGLFSNKIKYEIEINDKSSKTSKITIIIIDNEGYTNFEVFELGCFHHLMQSYSIYVNATKYIIRFNVDSFIKSKGINREELLSRISSDYVEDMLVSYDFNSKAELMDAVYLFLSNSILISSRTYNLMQEKLEYYGYDRDVMLEMKYTDKLDMSKKYDNKVYFDKLLYEVLYQIYEITFINQHSSPNSRKATREIYNNYLNTL